MVDYSKMSSKYDFKFIDLFAGIGGMRMAFENAGGTCVFSSEWNKFSKQTYMENFGDMPDGDITEIGEHDIPDHDILVAGFPCQPFSIAGVSSKNYLKRPHGFEDKTQGTLFFDICRIINAKKPRAFLLENVKNLKSHDKGNTFKVILNALREELGYDVHHGIIDASTQVPQHRERVFIVGFQSPTEFKFPKLRDKNPRLGAILEKRVGSKYTLTEGTWNAMKRHMEHHKKLGHGFGYNIADKNGVAKTMSARYYKDGAEILISRGANKIPRMLTPRECARLMGFPEKFKIPVSDNQAYRQFGNSVVVPVVKAVARQIVKSLACPRKRITIYDYM